MAISNQALISSPVPQVAAVIPRRHIRVLVVDDSPDFLDVICGVLEMEDFIEVVGKATDGTAAIQAASELHPDLVLMDVQMPYMNGLTAALLLSQHFPEIKVILMSADDSLQTRIACKSSGARGFVHKPSFQAAFFAVLDKIYNEVTPAVVLLG
jgi:DNA-binding NarL/FixJ family response regulator